jgi:hypothetical protein
MLDINGVKITGDNVARAIDYNFPDGIINCAAIMKKKWYNYLILFGIRVRTCDTSVPDDIIGGIRLKKGFFGYDYWEILMVDATTDPTPSYLRTPMSDARALGGTAWVVEGQYEYYRPNAYFDGFPQFRPTKPVAVYRWNPTQKEINDLTKKGIPLSNGFEEAKANGKVKIDATASVLIHRSWSNNKLSNDSAGCQVFANNGALLTINKWAKEHEYIYKSNKFVYNLFTKEMFSNDSILYGDIFNSNTNYLLNPINMSF